MGKKLMIVKPTPCCGNDSSVGLVREHDGRELYAYSYCKYCGHVSELADEIGFDDYGKASSVEEYRIIWLPDEQDVLDHDEQLELTA